MKTVDLTTQMAHLFKWQTMLQIRRSKAEVSE